MKFPKFQETFIPILEVLSDNKAIHYNELRKRVRDTFFSHLPAELLNKRTKSGDILILNRIGWGKSYLKQGKFVDYPERGMVQITPKGKELLSKGSITLKELNRDPDYLAYQEAKKDEKKHEQVEEIENASPQDLIDSAFTSIEAQVKYDLLERIKKLDPYYFEKIILQLLKKMGYGDFEETPKSNDGGIDGIMNQDKLGLEKIYIQAKRYAENKVREKDIRNFIGAMSGDTLKGVFVTTSEFDTGAIEKAEQATHKIILIDGKKLVDLMHKFDVGVQVSNTYEVKEIDEDFFIEG